jgi:hypothetical protein
MTNPRIGSTFESFLREEGIHDELMAEAAVRVREWQMKHQRESADRDDSGADDRDCPPPGTEGPG